MSAPAADEPFPLQGLARLVLDDLDAADWLRRVDGMWCHLQPPGHGYRRQGWKLHVSATPLSAPAVLVRAARTLVRHGCAFKFAAGLDQVEALVSTRCERGSGGKFITAYPRDDEQLRELAAELDRVVGHLPGPQVLSDRPYRPGSTVHFRYGAFTGVNVLTNDGSHECRLEAPDGTLVEDARTAWFNPPPWARSSLPVDPPETGTPRTGPPTTAAPAVARPSAVLLADRFVVREAIQHANKGGVFRAVDRTTGAEVVIKQARPHVGASLAGTDARDALRREAALLDLLEPLGITPRTVCLFEKDGHVFLAEESIPGATLRNSVNARMRDAVPGLPSEEVVPIVRGLVDLLSAVHATGLVLRDFTPNNVMVTPGGDLRLIDLEWVTRPGTWVQRAYTPGFGAPEQVAAAKVGPAPAPAADLFGLGATVFFTVTGVDAVLPEDQPPTRPVRDRIAGVLAPMAVHDPTVRRFAPLVLGLLADDPHDRWDLDRVRSFLDDVRDAGPGSAVEPDPDAARLPLADQRRLLADGLAHVVATMDRDGRKALWESGPFGATTDPCNVQHGAGGVLAVLSRAADALGAAGPHRAVREVADWVAARLGHDQRVLPGLYFGRSGTACALYEAGRVLDDDTLKTTALDLARRIPLRWPNPDVCHGAAGAGLAQLSFWRATGDEEFAGRVRECADHLVATADRATGGALWTVPRDFDSVLAGTTRYGFGHGSAGIGAFLLAAGQATGCDGYLELAHAAGRTLAAAAVVDDSGAWWPADRSETGKPTSPLAPHWCSGSSGIGTFLVRLHAATGDARSRELAEQAALAVYHRRWRGPAAACHGVAGDGEFLLDLADLLDEPRYRRWAEELAMCAFARHALRDGRVVVADETMHDVRVDYGTGLSGLLGFQLRLLHGGPRLWLPAPQPTLVAVGR